MQLRGNKFAIILLIPLFILTNGCKKGPELEGFDSERWIKDKKACAGIRKDQFSKILDTRDQWIGMDDDDMLKLLGKPDRSDYFDRGRKSYTYFVEEGNQCDSKFPYEGKKLTFEIDALGFLALIQQKK